MKDAFHFIQKPYNLRNDPELQRRRNRTVYFGTERISSLAPKIWELIPRDIRSANSLAIFKEKIMDVGTCSIHIANNAFLEGIECLKDNVNVDQFVIDLHFFFRLFAARRKGYGGVSELADVTTHYVIKHSQTRWVSLDKVLVRIIEHNETFLKTLPTLPGFKGKNGVSQN